MKNLFIILTFCLAVVPSFAQKFINKTVSWSQGQTVNIKLHYGDSIRVRYWDKPEISFDVSGMINGGRFNEAVLISSDVVNGEVNIRQTFDQMLLKRGKAEDCPGQNAGWSKDGKEGRQYVCMQLYYEIYLPQEASLKLETIKGDITVEGATSGVFAKTVTGFIDMTWPKTKGADVTLMTVSGELYTDLDISFNNRNFTNLPTGYPLKGTANGGGSIINLQTVGSNVYLRKRD